MSTLNLPSVPWPKHHDGKPLTMGEIQRNDPALARRLGSATLLRVLADIAAPGASVVVVETAQGVAGQTAVALPFES